MKYVPLVWAGLWRKPLRTTLTFFAITTAFILFGLLQGISATLDQAVASGHLDRLYVMSRLNNNGDLPLPLGHLARIRQVPGVLYATPMGGIGGYYQDPANLVVGWAMDPDSFFDVFTELKIPPDQVATWKQNRTSAIVGAQLAAKYGWKIGDRVPLRGADLRQDGTNDWAFDIAGIAQDTSGHALIDFSMRMAIHLSYYEEARAKDRGTVLAFVATVADPTAARAIAAAIDAQFANSADETETISDKDYTGNVLAQLGNIKVFVSAIIIAVFFTLLFLTANTVAQAVRERTSELAVLRSLGFSDVTVQGLVLSETLTLCVTAAVLGLAIVAAVFPSVSDQIISGLGRPLRPDVIALGLFAAVVLAIVTTFQPMRRIGRMSIVDALLDR